MFKKTGSLLTVICTCINLKNTSEFVSSIILSSKPSHIGTTDQKKELFTTSTRENFEASYLEWLL